MPKEIPSSLCPLLYIENGQLLEHASQCDETSLRALRALINCQINLVNLKTEAERILLEIIPATQDKTRNGGYLLLDEGNGHPVIIPVGKIAEDKIKKYQEVARIKCQWLIDHPDAQSSAENVISPNPERMPEYGNIIIPGGAVVFQREEQREEGKRVIISFSGLVSGEWDEKVVRTIAEKMCLKPAQPFIHPLIIYFDLF